MDKETIEFVLGLVASAVGVVIYVEARFRSIDNRLNEARQHGEEARGKSIEEVRSTMDARIAKEGERRALIEKELAEHKLEMMRELRDIPTLIDSVFERRLAPLFEQMRAFEAFGRQAMSIRSTERQG